MLPAKTRRANGHLPSLPVKLLSTVVAPPIRAAHEDDAITATIQGIIRTAAILRRPIERRRPIFYIRRGALDLLLPVKFLSTV